MADNWKERLADAQGRYDDADDYEIIEVAEDLLPFIKPRNDLKVIELDPEQINGRNREIHARVYWQEDDAKADAVAKDVASVLESAQMMLAMLKRLESEIEITSRCPVCNSFKGEHNVHCPLLGLADLIARAEGNYGR